MSEYLIKITNKNDTFTKMNVEAENLEDCIHKVFLNNQALRISSVKTLYIEKLKTTPVQPQNTIEERLINEKKYTHCSKCGNLMAPVDDDIDICWDCRLKRGVNNER